jgi:hypothetical protein
MKVLSFLIGAFMGAVVLGTILALVEAVVDLPVGPGWLVVAVPFMVWTGWLAANNE